MTVELVFVEPIGGEEIKVPVKFTTVDKLMSMMLAASRKGLELKDYTVVDKD